MSLSKTTLDAIAAMPAGARRELANEIGGAVHFLDAVSVERVQDRVLTSGAAQKRDELIAVIRILRS